MVLPYQTAVAGPGEGELEFITQKRNFIKSTTTPKVNLETAQEKYGIAQKRLDDTLKRINDKRKNESNKRKRKLTKREKTSINKAKGTLKRAGQKLRRAQKNERHEIRDTEKALLFDINNPRLKTYDSKFANPYRSMQIASVLASVEQLENNSVKIANNTKEQEQQSWVSSAGNAVSWMADKLVAPTQTLGTLAGAYTAYNIDPLAGSAMLGLSNLLPWVNYAAQTTIHRGYQAFTSKPEVTDTDNIEQQPETNVPESDTDKDATPSSEASNEQENNTDSEKLSTFSAIAGHGLGFVKVGFSSRFTKIATVLSALYPTSWAQTLQHTDFENQNRLYRLNQPVTFAPNPPVFSGLPAAQKFAARVQNFGNAPALNDFSPNVELPEITKYNDVTLEIWANTSRMNEILASWKFDLPPNYDKQTIIPMRAGLDRNETSLPIRAGYFYDLDPNDVIPWIHTCTGRYAEEAGGVPYDPLSCVDGVHTAAGGVPGSEFDPSLLTDITLNFNCPEGVHPEHVGSSSLTSFNLAQFFDNQIVFRVDDGISEDQQCTVSVTSLSGGISDCLFEYANATLCAGQEALVRLTALPQPAAFETENIIGIVFGVAGTGLTVAAIVLAFVKRNEIAQCFGYNKGTTGSTGTSTAAASGAP